MKKTLILAAVALVAVACSAVAQEPSQAEAVTALKSLAEPDAMRSLADALPNDGDALRAVADAVEADEFDAETLLAACPWCLGEIFELLACDGLTGAGGFDTSCQAAYDQCVSNANHFAGGDGNDYERYMLYRELAISRCGDQYDACMSSKRNDSLLCQIFLPFSPPPSSGPPPRRDTPPAPAL